MIRPNPFRAHDRQRQPDGMEGGAEIDREYPVPLCGRELGHRRHVLDSGVVDQDVEPAMRFHHHVDHPADRGRVGHVGVRIEGFHAEILSIPLRASAMSLAVPKPFRTTAAPLAAKALAMPRPMPLVDPVISATRPRNSLAGEVRFSEMRVSMRSLPVDPGQTFSPYWAFVKCRLANQSIRAGYRNISHPAFHWNG